MKTIIFHICIGMRKRGKEKNPMRLSQFLYAERRGRRELFPYSRWSPGLEPGLEGMLTHGLGAGGDVH